MEVPLKFKVGDKFTLPNNKYYNAVYVVSRIEKHEEYTRYWSKMDSKEVDGELWSHEGEMKRLTKLEQALK